MPWAPELFSAPALARVQEQRRRVSVPFFDGLMLTEEVDALVESFADEPELHHPVRGRIKGTQGFESFVVDMNAWLRDRNASVEDVERVVLARRGFEEVVLHLDNATGRVDRRSRSSPTSARMDASTNCGCTSAAGRCPATT